MKRIAFLLILFGLVSCGSIEVRIVNPNVEQQFHPQALATAEPRFSWQYETSANNVIQTSYRIIVASTVEKAQKGEVSAEVVNALKSTVYKEERVA